MIHIVALNKTDADEFYRMVTTGELPIYNYPDIITKLKSGYTLVTEVEHLDQLVEPKNNLLYTPLAETNPNISDILDAVALIPNTPDSPEDLI